LLLELLADCQIQLQVENGGIIDVSQRQRHLDVIVIARERSFVLTFFLHNFLLPQHDVDNTTTALHTRTMTIRSTQRIAQLATRAARTRSLSTAASGMPKQLHFNAMPAQIPKFKPMPKQEPKFKPMPKQDIFTSMPPQEPVVLLAGVAKPASGGGGMAVPLLIVAAVGGGGAYAYSEGMISM
jgi:hypothetical protein